MPLQNTDFMEVTLTSTLNGTNATAGITQAAVETVNVTLPSATYCSGLYDCRERTCNCNPFTPDCLAIDAPAGRAGECVVSLAKDTLGNGSECTAAQELLFGMWAVQLDATGVVCLVWHLPYSITSTHIHT